jgi:hypothetical protein
MPGWLDRLTNRRPKSTKPRTIVADESKTIRISPRELPPELAARPQPEDKPIEEEPLARELPSAVEESLPPEIGGDKTVAMPGGLLRPRRPGGTPAQSSDEPSRAVESESIPPGDSPTIALKIAYQAQHFPAGEQPPAASPRSAAGNLPSGVEDSEAKRSREQALVQARERLNSVQEKINRIAEEFAEGQVNRAQFQELFDHYQRERRTILAWIDTTAEVPNWRELAAEGRSMMIRRQHKARVLGYAICDQQSGLPLRSIGMFEEDPELVVPMLTAYRSATEEIFGAGIRSTEIEGGRWLCFVAGEFTMLMVLFSNEPARKDLEGLDELLRTFERMNRYILRRRPVKPDDLFLPYRFYIDSPK